MLSGLYATGLFYVNIGDNCITSIGTTSICTKVCFDKYAWVKITSIYNNLTTNILIRVFMLKILILLKLLVLKIPISEILILLIIQKYTCNLFKYKK